MKRVGRTRGGGGRERGDKLKNKGQAQKKLPLGA